MTFNDISESLLKINNLNESGIIPIKDSNFWLNRQKPRNSLEFCAKIFDKIKGKNIVEVGTGLQGEISGNSMEVWTSQTNAENIYAIDLDIKQLESLKCLKNQFTNLTLVHDDAFNFIEKIDKKIDLLYLDYWVDEKDEKFFGDARAKSYLAFYQKAKHFLNKTSIILLDDTDHISPWKQTYILPEARMDGFQVIYTGRQTMLIRIENACC